MAIGQTVDKWRKVRLQVLDRDSLEACVQCGKYGRLEVDHHNIPWKTWHQTLYVAIRTTCNPCVALVTMGEVQRREDGAGATARSPWPGNGTYLTDGVTPCIL